MTVLIIFIIHSKWRKKMITERRCKLQKFLIPAKIQNSKKFKNDRILFTIKNQSKTKFEKIDDKLKMNCE